MALLDDVKVALRVATDDAGITGQINDLIEEAKARPLKNGRHQRGRSRRA